MVSGLITEKLQRVSKNTSLIGGMETSHAKELILRLAKKGFTLIEVADLIGMPDTTILLWMRMDVTFKQDFESAQEEPSHMVEQSLFRRALGYATREITKENQKPTKVVEKMVNPDVTAIIFWLKNRMPKRWRDVTQIEFSLKDRMDRAYKALDEGKR